MTVTTRSMNAIPVFIGLIVLSLVFSQTNRKSVLENFMPVQTEQTNSTALELANSRIGTFDNISRVLEDPKLLQEYLQINRNFPLSVRQPLLQSSTAETPIDQRLLRSGGLPDQVIDKFVPSKSRRNKGRFFEQNPKRVAVNVPTPENELFLNSSGAKNFISVGPGLYDTRLREAINEIKNRYPVNPAEFIGTKWQIINRFTPVQAEEIRNVAQVFIDLVNKVLTEKEGKESRFIWLDKEDAQIEKSYPIKKVPAGSEPTSNLQREFTKYTIVFFMVDRDALLNRGIKGVFIRDTTEDSPISPETIRILSAELVGEKGAKLLSGPAQHQELWNLGRSRDEQRITENDILKGLKKRALKSKEDEVFCFGSTLPMTTTSQTECESAGGIFDRQVRVNDECPFFKSNKNYINSRGGVKGGFCEMPLGMNLKGFRFPDLNPASKPLCYNCINGFYGFKTIGPCCEDQQNDRVAYPTLASPDYAFPSDTRDRFAARKQLHTRDLSWARRGFNFENTPPGITADILREQELNIAPSIFGQEEAERRAAIPKRDTIVTPSGRLVTVGDEQALGAKTRPLLFGDLGVTSEVV